MVVLIFFVKGSIAAFLATIVDTGGTCLRCLRDKNANRRKMPEYWLFFYKSSVYIKYQISKR